MKAGDRKFVLVDLENLGGASPRNTCTDQYASAYEEVKRSAQISEHDLVVIGVNPALAFVARAIDPAARLVTRRGPDGADRALIDELRSASFLAGRFSEVVVASGDHAFLESVIRLNQAGLDTTVAALPGSLSTALRLAARRVIWLSQSVGDNAAA